MAEHDEKADELERQADRLGEQSDEVQDDIDQVRSDFESKISDASQAPGLLDEESAAPGGLGKAEEDGDDDADE
jgi:outer membrane murein-binding lipoprotein Lpp